MCPLIFTGYISISSRSYVDDHAVPTGNLAQDAAVYAYVPYIKATDKLFGSTTKPNDHQAMLSLANKWSHAVQRDELQPLVPISFEDTPEDGARGDIFHAKSTLVAGLLEDATLLARQGHAHDAVHEAILATRVSESLKYSDFDSVYVASAEEERASMIINKVARHLDPADKALVRNGLNAITANSKDLDDLTRFSRIQYYDYQERMSETPISIEDVHRTVALTNQVASDPSSRKTMNFVRQALLASSSDDDPEYLSDLRLAWVSENTNESEIHRVLAAL